MANVMKAFNVYAGYKTDGDLGIEIEVEGNALPITEDHWNMERDYSLRGESCEYVLKRPGKYEDVVRALDYLDMKYKLNNTEVHDSVRAGVHVHVNVQHLTTKQLFTFMSAYMILEEVLVSFCGEYREGNLFCLRIKDAEYLQYIIGKVANDKRYENFNSDHLRYSSMNVVSLSKFGSLEFRAMRGTRDLSVIKNWAKILLDIRNASMDFDSPLSLVEEIEKNGVEWFLERFLGTFTEEVCKGKDINKYLSDGLVRANTLARNVDWLSFDTREIGGLEFPANIEFPDEPQEDF
jgi:hypothetical protein